MFPRQGHSWKNGIFYNDLNAINSLS